MLAEFDAEAKFDVKPTVETSVEIFPEMVGSVLGKAGATIKVIRQKSAATVRVEGEHHHDWGLLLCGTVCVAWTSLVVSHPPAYAAGLMLCRPHCGAAL